MYVQRQRVALAAHGLQEKAEVDVHTVRITSACRLVGVHVLERQRATLVAHIAALLTAAVVHAYRAGGAAKAAKLRRLLVQQAGPGER